MHNVKKKTKVIQHTDIKPSTNGKAPDPVKDVQAASRHPLEKAIDYIKERYEVRYNQLLLEPELREIFTDDAGNVSHSKKFVLEDAWTYTIWFRMKIAHHNVTPKIIEALLRNRDYFTSYHPFKDYFTALKWDEKDHIKELADTITIANIKSNDGQFVMQDIWYPYLKKWLVSVVANALEINSSDQMLIFNGEGGEGKSRWAKKLIPAALQEYFHPGWIIPSSTEESTCNLLAEKLLISLEDQLQYCSAQEYGKLKNLITVPSVSNRKRFHRQTPKRSRTASFIGSVDQPGFLTGYKNRRYLIFTTTKINYDHAVNMDQVWAQAYQLLHEKFQYWFTPEESKVINQVNEIFRTPSKEEELIQRYFRPADDTDNKEDIEFMTATDIHIFLSKETGDNRISLHRLGSALSEMKYNRPGVYDKSKKYTLYKYEVVKLLKPKVEEKK